jgi:hypothetical protein
MLLWLLFQGIMNYFVVDNHLKKFAWPWKVDGNTNSWRAYNSKYLMNIKQVDDFGTLLNGIIYIHLYYNFYIMH